VAPVNPEHLFEQALKLAESDIGRPRQADLRRAISSAYYGLFHAVSTAAADLFIGTTNRSNARYELVYRSVDHRWLRDVCAEATKQSVGAKFAPYIPRGGFGLNLKAFATAVVDLYQQRLDADYNPSNDVIRSEARTAVATAKEAFDRFQSRPMNEMLF
jgi:uncharacterized protein (UPF0332 family)